VVGRIFRYRSNTVGLQHSERVTIANALFFNDFDVFFRRQIGTNFGCDGISVPMACQRKTQPAESSFRYVCTGAMSNDIQFVIMD
jgi:hypothetical protein